MGESLIKKANKRQGRIGRRAKKKYYKNYKKLNTHYKPENCFIINKKLYYK